jgi:glycosyltransferase involved in cell wall biosynthesis
LSRDRVHVVYNGIDLKAFSDIPSKIRGENQATDGALRVGTVGRLVGQKGIEYFLRAAVEVRKEFPNTKFFIVGDGPDRESLERLTDDLGIRTQVVFSGSRSDMPNVYASLDVFVLASIDEGMPMALLEALAARKAAVASFVGAIGKVIKTGQSGMLVPARDVEALAAAIATLLRDANLRTRLGENGCREVRENYSSQAMAYRYRTHYELMLGQHT